MAVQNKYVNPSLDVNGLVVNPPGTPLAFRGGNGSRLFSLYETFTIAAADSNGSIYRIVKALDPNLIPINIFIGNDAIAGAVAFNLGLYKTNSAAGFGAIVGTGDQFLTGGTLAAAHASTTPGVGLNGLSNLPQYTRYRRLFEIAGETEIAPTIATTRVDAFDLVLTLTTAGGNAGNVELLMTFAQG